MGALDEAISTALSTSGQAILFVALAIAAGFSVYTISDYYPVRVCGIFIPVTMAVSSLTALTLLPALVKIIQPRFLIGPARRRSAVPSSPLPSAR